MEDSKPSVNISPMSRRSFVAKTALVVALAGTSVGVGYCARNVRKIRALNNALRIGHCAPSVMQTLLDCNEIENHEMVVAVGALAGGIAGASTECGCLMSPLLFSSYINKDVSPEARLKLIGQSQRYAQEFKRCFGGPTCENIRQGGVFSCVRAMTGFSSPFEAAGRSCGSLPAEKAESYILLMKAFGDRRFHCSQSVLLGMEDRFCHTEEQLRALWICIGGIAMQNLTCGALTAGAMAIGAATAKLEMSYARVARMNWLLLHDRVNEAMQEHVNHFNRAILMSDELGQWFRSEFGSTSCRGIWGLDFSKSKDAEIFITGNCMDRCQQIVQKVVGKVGSIVA